MSARALRVPSSGFTLLEVMISLAILALALVSLLEIATNNVRNTNHAKLMTMATFLSRTRIADLEDQILETGFGEMDQDEEGTFEEQGYPQFRWTTLIERVELPTDIATKTQDQASDLSQSDNPMSAMTGLLGGFMSTLIEPIRIGLQEAVRRLTVRVMWNEIGRPEQSFEIVTFMTDPSKLDMALPGAAGAQGAQGGTPAGGGTTGGGQRNSTVGGSNGRGGGLGGGLGGGIGGGPQP